MIEGPSKIIISGDPEAGKALIGTGHRQMAILENLMRFQGLEQYSIKMSPYPGAVIVCRKVFGLRTIEIATGARRMQEEPVRFIYGKIPLLMAGMYELDGEIPSLGKVLISYTTPFVSTDNLVRAVGPTEHFTQGGKQFLQVRYLLAQIPGPEESSRELIPSLALAVSGSTFRIKAAFSEPLPSSPVLDTGKTFDPIDSMDDGVNDLARVYYLKPGYKVYTSTTEIALADSEGVLSVNYSTDKTRLFVAYGFRSAEEVITDYLSSPGASSTISFIVYQMVVAEGFSNIAWEIESQGTYTVPYFIQDLFADEDGKIWGPYKPYRVDGVTPTAYTVEYSCATVDIFTGDTSSASKFCVGNTIVDGKFAGVFYDMKVEFLTNILGMTTTYNNVITSEYFSGPGMVPGADGYAYETYYDGVGYTGGPWYDPYVESGTFDSQYVIYSSGNFDATMWRSYDGTRHGENCQDITVYAGDQSVNTVASGNRTHNTAYIYGHYEQRSHPITGPPPWYTAYTSYDSILLNKKITEDLEQHDVADTVTVQNGLVSSRVQSSMTTRHRSWDKSWDAYFEGNEGAPNIRIAGYTAQGDYPDDPYYDPDGTVSDENGYFPFMEYEDIEETSVPEACSIKYPLTVSNAIGATSFIAWDNNPQGVMIKGVRYTTPTDLTTALFKATINDIDVSAKLLQLSGLTPQYVHYVGFLF